jgi:hypothetical protein
LPFRGCEELEPVEKNLFSSLAMFRDPLFSVLNINIILVAQNNPNLKLLHRTGVFKDA